jgi:predicted 3-demethylubiquinone-9 3-methyltransferase (glyoxalase superfamily)
MQKITPFLWFESQANEAAQFYTTVFKNCKIVSSNPMSTTFELEGVNYTAFNGGPHYKLTPSFSLFISCDTQEEVDMYWDKLLEGGGREDKCGWLQDRYGVSWQVIPKGLEQLLFDADREKGQRAMDAMMTMKKLDIAALRKAHYGN